MREWCPKVLFIDDEIKQNTPGGEAIRRIIRALEEKKIEVISVEKGEDGKLVLQAMSDICSVIVDWVLQGSYLKEEALIESLREISPIVPIFIITDKKEAQNIPPEVWKKINGYIWKTEDSPAFISQRIEEEIKRYVETQLPPFFKELKNYVEKARYSWHTPGHSGGLAFYKTLCGTMFAKFFGENTLRADLSVSVPELGSLLESTGPVREAEEIAAQVFGAHRTYFVTNGTSTANKIVFYAVVNPGDKVIIERNCHKSVHHAVLMRNVKPVYLEPSTNKLGILGPTPIEKIERALDSNPDAKLLVITNSTYDGLIHDTKKIIEMSSKKGIPVLVDEAWFGYARFHPFYKNRAAMLAAEEVENENPDLSIRVFSTQSTHKVLAAFSQASMLHIRDKNFLDHQVAFDEAFMMFTSTSPQYSMIASLDVATYMMKYFGGQLVDEVYKEAMDFKEVMNRLYRDEYQRSGKEWFRVLEESEILKSLNLDSSNVMLDPLKVTIATDKINVPAKIVEEYLREKGFQVEKTGSYTFLILFTIGITKGKWGSIIAALTAFDIEKYKNLQFASPPLPPFSIPPMKVLPHEAYQKVIRREYEKIDLKNAVGRISACMVVPYPPGIPVLIPGEEITDEVKEYIEKISEFNKKTEKNLRVEIHGLPRGEEEHVYEGIYVLA